MVAGNQRCAACSATFRRTPDSEGTVVCDQCGHKSPAAVEATLDPYTALPRQGRKTFFIALLLALTGGVAVFALVAIRQIFAEAGNPNAAPKRLDLEPIERIEVDSERGPQKVAEAGGNYPEPDIDPTITEAETSKAATELVKTLLPGAVGHPADYFDEDASREALLAGLPRGSPLDQEAVKRNFKREWRGTRTGYAELFQKFKSARFLRVRRIERGLKAVVFVRTKESGDFLILSPKRTYRGVVRFGDFVMLGNGRPMSKQLRQTIIETVFADNRSLSFASPRQRELLRASEIVEKAMTAHSAGDLDEAARIIRTLPASVQDDRYFLICRMSIFAEADDPECDAVMNRYAKLYPTDKSICFLRFACLEQRKKWSELPAAAAEVAQYVGGSSFIDALLSQVLLLAGDREGARKAAKSAVADDETLIEAYRTLVACAGLNGDFAEAVRWLDQLERCDPKEAELYDPSNFGGLGDSKEYRAWKAKRR